MLSESLQGVGEFINRFSKKNSWYVLYSKNKRIKVAKKKEKKNRFNL
jgi:hypothetical protein